MLKQLLLLLLVTLSHQAIAQKGKAVLILKDSTRVNGYGEISGVSTTVSIMFENDTLRWKKYNGKDLIGIDILEHNYYRKFRYKYIDGGKYPRALEVVSLDSLSLYVKLYEGRALSNSFVSVPQPTGDLAKPQTIILEDGKEVPVASSRNLYNEINLPRYSYYVGYGESDQVEHLYTKGIPFAKSFKKAMTMYFENCPELLEKVENKEFSNTQLGEVLDFYNSRCLKADSTKDRDTDTISG
ncbi:MULTISPECIES: hypothetical protein [Leeuwenhoekiella]|jgi:hypothetical protein|uniref:Uncharacterized protein n=1 Tax=Leeuwenhoekiella blandensis (strain CECT 7118 / CCUG 51940 / KCTC 22103 / MED217) TaxID=398720 RepID=A3XKZ9_LEEBM|nr:MULTISPECIES: hypothetical protein [Leeuwenhoekiella]EAQ49770.1 hypothetical protein MED217_01430 [Leeuwenhoekiella blandensis MED217]MAO43303.1 hypothetical protein [Leeuwenhoekiella sp.]HBT10427.1 hypothetical protein [Leeuwenhoekiella sp.]HCW65515.1 hypothetical protein [Leeuwenhoekiella sp.]|tara:strand:- start:413 stop:1135 length:723 start_codon:yes stop_codon:yes gene_type:complete